MKLYRSPYEAYPFLSDDDGDLRCDFEILTDRISSTTGLLAALCPERREELLKLDELIYHANPTLRTFMSVTPEEIAWLKERTEALQEETKGLCERFVLPAGTPRACVAHILRTDGKRLVRMLYRHAQRGGKVEEALFDFANLVSGYFFLLALQLNHADGFKEVPFVSRNYPE
ncbi:MAG: hypothetical protein ACI4MF_07135 [Candidatus Faecivicinus sp.]